LGHGRDTESHVMSGNGMEPKRMKGLEPSTFCMARTGRELTGDDWG